MKKLAIYCLKVLLLKVIKKKRVLAIIGDDNQHSAFNNQEWDVLDIISKYGYFESLKNKLPVDKLGDPLPWYTYPAIEYIKQLDLTNKTVFEWGGGYSSLFYAKRAAKVFSVEDDKDWFEKIASKKPSNLEMFYAKDEMYVSKISEIGIKFDIIVIDAQHRYKCAVESINFLKDGGLIVLDNSDWFKNTAKYIRECGFIQTDFFGFGPINNYTWTTSIFYSRNFKLLTKENIQPSYPIGGLTNVCD